MEEKRKNKTPGTSNGYEVKTEPKKEMKLRRRKEREKKVTQE